MLTDIYSGSQIRIKEDSHHCILMVTWTGRQTEETVKDGCHRIYEAMLALKYFDIFNDNRHVIGDWSDAAEWVGSIWLPLMHEAGMHKFAWVKGKLDMPKASIAQSLASTPDTDIPVKTFTDYNNAIDWLLEGSL